ncbi:MAG: rod shape-determining protein RodA, partial [bacterium (Candidatus Ratteibacteria) CG23_combo_of_CG06-09_8_20_14_all_48_7]
FYFQPSEFAKLIYIFTLGNYFERNKDSVKRFTTFLWAFLFIFLPLFILILLQPNLGTAFVFLPIFFAVAYIAGTPKKHLLTLSGLGLLALPVFWLFLRDYQKRRISVFLNPGIDPLGAGYNILQSRIAIGSGGFFGKGFLRGTQT